MTQQETQGPRKVINIEEARKKRAKKRENEIIKRAIAHAKSLDW